MLRLTSYLCLWTVRRTWRKRNFKRKIRCNNCSSAASSEQQVWLGKRNQCLWRERNRNNKWRKERKKKLSFGKISRWITKPHNLIFKHEKPYYYLLLVRSRSKKLMTIWNERKKERNLHFYRKKTSGDSDRMI